MDDFIKYTFSFSDFIVDPQANLLIRTNSEKRLEPKVIALLSLLASSDNRVISKQEIRDNIWPNVIVGDEAIARAIFSLRKALADDAKNPSYIETIPKKGYRFLVKANLLAAQQTCKNSEEANESIINVVASLVEHQIKKFIKPLNKWLISVFLLVTLTIIISLWTLNSTESDFSAIELILPVTTAVGNERDFSLNQFSHEIAYIHDNGDQTALFVKALSGKSQLLKVAEYDGWLYSPLWLDKHTLLYIRGRKSSYQIIRQHKQQAAEVLYQSSNGLFQLAVKTVSAKEVIFTEFNRDKAQPFAVKHLNLVNGEITDLREVYANIPETAYDILYSAGGERLYFTHFEQQKEHIYQLNLLSKELSKIGEGFEEVEHLALGNSDQLLISGTHSDIQGLWSLTLSTAKHALLIPASSGQKIINGGMDKEGDIYYGNYQEPLNLAVVNTVDKSLTQLPELNTNGRERSGVFADSGNLIYYISNRSGHDELWSYQLNTQTNQQITQLEASDMSRPVVSKSGQYLAIAYQKNDINLAVIDLFQGQVIKSKVVEKMQYPLAWSKDEQSIYISEHHQQVNLYQYDRSTLSATIIQKFAGLSVNVSESGDSIVFVDYQHQGLVEKNLITGQITKGVTPIDNLDNLMPGELKITENAMFFLRKSKEKTTLMQQDLTLESNSSALTELITITESISVSDIGKSGDKLLYFQFDKPQGGIMKLKLK